MTENLEKGNQPDEGDGFRWDWGSSDSWIWGGILLLGGSILLIQNLTDFSLVDLGNWWAIFILAPGISNLARAARWYSLRGRVTAGIRNAGFWGLVLVATAFTFMFNIGWSMMLPFLLIAAGIFLLLTAKRN